MPLRRPFIFLFAVCLSAGALRAQDAAPTLYQKVRAAYDGVQTYHADQTFEISRMDGRVRMIQTFEVAFDRSAVRLRVDQPQVLVVHDGGTLYVKPSWMPGQHLAQPIRAKLSFSKLLRAAPYLEQPPLPDVAMLLGAAPVDDRKVTELPADDAGRGQLLFDTPQGPVVLTIDPKTSLVTELKWRLSGAMIEGADPDEQVVATLVINLKQRDEPLDEKLFSRDWGTQLAGAGGPDGDAHAEAKAMEGQPAPPVQLRDLEGNIFELAAVEDRVVVLDFWATWCTPCEIGLAELADVVKWAGEKKLSVRVVAVNRAEEKNVVEAFWKKHDFGFATILDSHDLVSNAYRVNPIPHTVFIHDGKIAVVQIGTGRGAAEHYKEIITDLLEGDEG